MPVDIYAVKRIMIDKNISHSDLAKKMEVTPGRISNMLSGRTKRYRVSTIHSLATALGVSTKEIFKEE